MEVVGLVCVCGEYITGEYIKGCDFQRELLPQRIYVKLLF